MYIRTLRSLQKASPTREIVYIYRGALARCLIEYVPLRARMYPPSMAVVYPGERRGCRKDAGLAVYIHAINYLSNAGRADVVVCLARRGTGDALIYLHAC